MTPGAEAAAVRAIQEQLDAGVQGGKDDDDSSLPSEEEETEEDEEKEEESSEEKEEHGSQSLASLPPPPVPGFPQNADALLAVETGPLDDREQVATFELDFAAQDEIRKKFPFLPDRDRFSIES